MVFVCGEILARAGEDVGKNVTVAGFWFAPAGEGEGLCREKDVS